MPAYFSMKMEFSRAELDFDNMKELYHYLKYAGLEFKSGAFSAENDTIEDILEWNQKKLEKDFVLGEDEHYENGYKQMYFSFGGFSEVRGILFNQDPVEREYLFELIVPEDEVTADGVTYKKEAVEKLKALATILWVLPKMRTLQTELENGKGITPEAEIKEGKAPAACPFAIVSEKQFGNMDTSAYNAEHINAGGVILMPKNIKLA